MDKALHFVKPCKSELEERWESRTLLPIGQQGSRNASDNAKCVRDKLCGYVNFSLSFDSLFSPKVVL